MQPTRFLRTLTCLTLMFALCGCGSSDSSGDPADGAFQFINALADSPTLALNIRLDDDDFQIFSSFGFQQATSLNTVNRDVYSYELTYEDPLSGDEVVLLPETEFEVLRDTIHSFVLSGTFAQPRITTLESPLDVFDPDLDELQLRALNISSDTVAVYLGDPDAGLNARHAGRRDRFGRRAPGRPRGQQLSAARNAGELRATQLRLG